MPFNVLTLLQTANGRLQPFSGMLGLVIYIIVRLPSSPSASLAGWVACRRNFRCDNDRKSYFNFDCSIYDACLALGQSIRNVDEIRTVSLAFLIGVVLVGFKLSQFLRSSSWRTSRLFWDRHERRRRAFIDRGVGCAIIDICIDCENLRRKGHPVNANIWSVNISWDPV